jgi:tetratricopeptide (TPR) repeat protein
MVLLVFVLLAPAYAQQDVDEKYLWIYSLIQQGESLVEAGDSHAALPVLLDAQTQLQRFQKLYPDWNPGLVRFRLTGVTEKIAGLKESVVVTNPPPAKVETSAAPTAAPITAPITAPATAPAAAPAAAPAESAQLRAQMDRLTAQLQNAQTENETLQAKLKEALAAQPAAVDAGELTRLQAQFRYLMKENELLKAGTSARGKVAVKDTEAVAKARRELAGYEKKYAGQQARADQLAAENAKWQKSGALNAAALDELRVQNRKLNALLAAPATAPAGSAKVVELSKQLSAARAEIATLKASVSGTAQDQAALAELRAQNQKLNALLAAPAASSSTAADLSAQLRAARADITALKASVAEAALEKAALEKKISRQSAELADLRAANFEAQIRDLTAARDDLQKQLKAAAGKDSGLRQEKDQALKDASLAALNVEVASLRARVAVAEAKAVPFSAEELELLKQASPQLPVVAQKTARDFSAGTAELAASAQQHFAKHEFTAAEADYEKILEREPNNGLMLANLATIELQEDKLADAEKHITAAVAQSPKDAYNLATLGYLKFRQEKYDEALEVLSRAAELDPKNPEIQNYLGVTLSHKGQRLQAEAALRKAIQLNPLYAPAHNNLAVIYLTQKPSSPLLARWHYQKAIADGQPRNPDFEKLLADQGAPVVP